MKNSPVIIKWKQQGKEQEKTIDRQQMFELMQAIKNGFDGDNEISTILVEIIPELEYIMIDKDRNEQLEVPIIICWMSNQTEKIVNIRRYHKIIWSILNKYCTQ